MAEITFGYTITDINTESGEASALIQTQPPVPVTLDSLPAGITNGEIQWTSVEPVQGTEGSIAILRGRRRQ